MLRRDCRWRKDGNGVRTCRETASHGHAGGRGDGHCSRSSGTGGRSTAQEQWHAHSSGPAALMGWVGAPRRRKKGLSVRRQALRRSLKNHRADGCVFGEPLQKVGGRRLPGSPALCVGLVRERAECWPPGVRLSVQPNKSLSHTAVTFKRPVVLYHRPASGRSMSGRL